MPTTKNIKIAFFHLAFLYSGGGEKLALKEISLLRSQGFEVDCFSPLVNAKECFPDILNKISVKEIIPNFTKIFRNKPEIGVILTCIFFPFVSWKYRKYDLVIGANQPGPVFGFILKLLFQIPYIIYLAQPTRLIYPRPIDQKLGLKLKNTMKLLPHIVNIFRPFFFWIDLKSISKADTFLCNGIYMQDILSQIYGRKPLICAAGSTIHGGTKDRYAQNVSSKQIYQVKDLHILKPYIFLSNRHFPHKKFEYALEILDSMPNKVPLLISGETTDYTLELKKLVAYYKLENYVHFLGYISEKELSALYSNTAVYLYTAPEEDFGMGVVEAMGYGIPVIAWDNAGPSKVITDAHDGFLINFNNKTKAVKLITNLLQNRDLYNSISQRAIQKIRTQYSWQNHLSIFLKSINDVAQNQTKAVNSPSFDFNTID